MPVSLFGKNGFPIEYAATLLGLSDRSNASFLYRNCIVLCNFSRCHYLRVQGLLVTNL
ncbi:MAG: hypothetical protein AAF208_00365 [Cyanobacteria bacterium P01_A01_bin.45]